jgi:hypothetical protein
MRYIKINTPLAVVGGFTVNEAVLVLSEVKSTEFTYKIYRDYSSYNARQSEIELQNKLPLFTVIHKEKIYYRDAINDFYLSILKQNEYDAEIVDTDAPKVDDVLFTPEYLAEVTESYNEINQDLQTEAYVVDLSTKYNEAKDAFVKALSDISYGGVLTNKSDVQEVPVTTTLITFFNVDESIEDKDAAKTILNELSKTFVSDLDSLSPRERIDLFESLSKYFKPADESVDEVKAKVVDKEVVNQSKYAAIKAQNDYINLLKDRYYKSL